MVPATYLSQDSRVAEEYEEEDDDDDSDNEEDLKEKPWYFEKITSRNHSNKILDKKGKLGDFLIRRAETKVELSSTVAHLSM